MSQPWQYQLRIDLTDDAGEAARRDPEGPALAPLPDILRRHDAAMKSQYDAFASYVAEAEERGVEHYPLYEWTRATIENPAKKAKYLKSFTLYVGGEEIYAKDKADALEGELQPLVGGGLVTRLAKHDTNPANNPQMPPRYRK
jgi:hypothetical protein